MRASAAFTGVRSSLGRSRTPASRRRSPVIGLTACTSATWALRGASGALPAPAHSPPLEGLPEWRPPRDMTMGDTYPPPQSYNGCCLHKTIDNQRADTAAACRTAPLTGFAHWLGFAHCCALACRPPSVCSGLPAQLAACRLVNAWRCHVQAARRLTAADGPL